MSFPIYPKHEFACPNVSHCPHLGGASVVSVARIANASEDTRDSLLHRIRVLEERDSELLSDVVELQKELEQVKLELKLERQNKLATNEQKNDCGPDDEKNTQPGAKTGKKRGAPIGQIQRRGSADSASSACR